MSNTAISKERVQKFLTDIFGTIEVDSNGDYCVQRSNVRVYLRVLPMNEQSTIVNVYSIVMRGLNADPGLYQSVNQLNQRMRFGTAILVDAEDGTQTYMLTHTLLADFLDKDELGYVVVGLLESAQELLSDSEGSAGTPAEGPSGENTLD